MSKRKDLVDAEVIDESTALAIDAPVEAEAEVAIDPRVEALAIAMREVYIKRLSVRSRPNIPLHFVELNSEERASWFAVAEFVING